VAWQLKRFARKNSLTPGQMFELYTQLERAGAASLNAYGENRYILRRDESTRIGRSSEASLAFG